MAGVLFVANFFDLDNPEEKDHPHGGRRALPARELAVGRRVRARHRDGLEPGARIHPFRLARLQRGDARLHPRARQPDASDLRRAPGRPGPPSTTIAGARSKDRHISPSDRCSATSTAPCGSTIAASRTASCTAGLRLLREQPARRAGAARLRDPQSARLARVRTQRLGPHRLRRSRQHQAALSRPDAAVLFVRRARREPHGELSTTARSRRPRSSPRCPSHRKSSCRR